MKPGELISLLDSLGIRPSKSRGQCFLIDEDIARRQVALAGIKEDEVVLEIGPGLGALTGHLSEKAKKVFAIEQDERLFGFLKDRMLGNTELIHGDALQVAFPRFDKMVSNLPYQISSPITFRLLNYQFSAAVLMYQKEFAERLVTESGRNSSRLSVKLYYRAESELLERVPRSAFYPVPDVDSAIVRLRPRKPPFKVDDEALFFKVIDCVYSHRRKKIHNCFMEKWRDFSKSRDNMKELLKALPFGDRRAEELEPEEMAELSNRLLEEQSRI